MASRQGGVTVDSRPVIITVEGSCVEFLLHTKADRNSARGASLRINFADLTFGLGRICWTAI